MQDIIFEKFKELGFSLNEAKVYIALLKKSPATGYEISQIANITQPRAYDALKSLELKNIINISAGKPVKYIPITPKELTKRYKQRFLSTINYLDKKLPDVKQTNLDPINGINGYDAIIAKVSEIIESAEKNIFLEIWNKDYKIIEHAIECAYDKGITIKIVGYGGLKTPFGLVYDNDINIDYDNNIEHRRIFLLKDDSECIFGHSDTEIVWTINKDIIQILKGFIIRDMYLLDITENFPEQLKYFYGQNFKKLRDKIFKY